MSEKGVMRDYGITFGEHRRGRLNQLTDIPGVRVGHATVAEKGNQTGVTAVLPVEDNMYDRPVFAASHVINGFGKSAGLLQVDELGEVETPILLTNTLNVGNVHRAVVEHMVRHNSDCRTVNPVVMECNDGFLSDIRRAVVDSTMVEEAIQGAGDNRFATGAVGAGRGMVCFGYKGGIGSSSRVIALDGREYHLGALVLTNFGRMIELTIKGQRIRPMVGVDERRPEDGSVIVLLGTDIPMEHRQLTRLCRRASFGIARTGGNCSSGSGEVVLAFSVGNRHCRKNESPLCSIESVSEHVDVINPIFSATIDCVEEAIIDSLFSAETVTGFEQRTVAALPVRELVKEYPGIVSD